MGATTWQRPNSLNHLDFTRLDTSRQRRQYGWSSEGVTEIDAHFLFFELRSPVPAAADGNK
jgi:hypothetical protein